MANCRCFSTLIVKNLVILIASCVLYSCSGEDWAKVAASEVLGLTNGASTGTLSARRPAATCDEMLAKAVVSAGEERALANKEREDAIKASQRALVLVETANEQLREANLKVSELSAQVNENCRNVTLALEDLKRSSKQQMENLREQTERQILDTRTEADLAVHEAIKQRDEAIALAQEEAARNITQQTLLHSDEIALLSGKLKEEVEAAQLRIVQWEEEAASNRIKMSEEMTAAVAEVEKKAEKRVQEVEEMAKHEVEAAQQKSVEEQAYAKSLMEQMELKFLEERNQTDYEALQRVTEANALLQSTIADAQEKIDAITVAKHEEIAALKADFEAQIHNIREASAAEIQSMQKNTAKLITEANLMRQTTEKEASKQIELLKKESADDIDRIKIEANNQIKIIQKESSEKTGLAEKNASRLSLIVSDLQKQIHALESERASLHEKLSATSNNLAYWESLEQPYCNFTLMKADSIRVLKNLSTVAVKETKSTYKLVQIYGEKSFKRLSKTTREKYVVLADTISDWILLIANDPRVQKMNKRVQVWYESNLEGHVNTYITPFYRLKVAPFLASMSKILSVGKLKAKIQIHYLWTLIIDSSKKLITVILEKSKASDAAGTKLPGYILYCFQYAEKYTEELIKWVLMVQACIVVVYFRAKLLRMATVVLLLPFQIIWWFSPLRLFLKFYKSPRKHPLKTTANSGTTVIPTSKTPSSQNEKSSKKNKSTC